MGRPSFKPTDKQREDVQRLAGLGVPQHDIAIIVGIAKPTLHKHFRSELDFGMAKANADIAGCLYAQAMSGNITALIFWAKARLGWQEKIVAETTVNANHHHVFTEEDRDIMEHHKRRVIQAYEADKARKATLN